MYESIEPPPWFAAWVSDYVTAFGTGDDFGSVMLRRWWPAFAAANYTPAELAEAMQKILMAPKQPAHSREHLPAVNAAVAEVRAKRVRVPRPGQDGGPACRVCNWGVILIVPYHLDVRDGEWVAPYRTGGVWCVACGPGRRSWEAACTRAHAEMRDAPRSLEKYELTVTPHWREMMAERDERERLMRLAHAASDGVRETAGAVNATLRRVTGASKL